MTTKTKSKNITWNFATYWLIDLFGIPTRYDDYEPKELATKIEELL